MSDANKQVVSLVEEVTPGTTPASPVWLPINLTGHTLKPQVRNVESRIIRPTRDIQDSVRVGFSAGGELPTELQYDASLALWKLMRSALQADSETAATTEVLSVAGAIDGTLSGTGVHTGVEVGDVVRVRTSGDVLVGYFRVAIVATDVITVEGSLDAGTGYKVRRGLRIKNGKTARPFSLEVADDINGDGTLDRWEYFTYAMPDTMSLQVRDGALTTINFGMVAKQSGGVVSSRFAGSTDGSSISTEVMDPKGHVKVIRVAGTDYPVTEATFQLANGLAAREVVGTLGAISIRSGSFRLSGQHTAYFEDMTEYNKGVNNTASSLLYVTEDTAGNAFAFVIPRTKYTSVARDNTGQDTDIFVQLGYSATYDSTDAVTMRILAFPA